MNTLAARAVVILVILASTFCAGVATGWKVNGWRKDSQRAADIAAVSQQVAIVAQAQDKSRKDALDRTVAMQREVEHAQQNAQARVSHADLAAAHARTELERLRQQIADDNRAALRISEAACTSTRAEAATARVLLGECSAEYQGVAATADSLTIEVTKLLESWPKDPNSK